MGAFGVLRRGGANLTRGVRMGVERLVLSRRAPFWLLLRLSPPFDETRLPGWALGRERPLGLLDALRALDVAARDPRVGGVLLRLGGAPHGLAHAMSLRRAIERLREAGRPVVAYGERIGLPEFWVASGADRLWLTETGSIHLVGLRSEGVFLSRLLGRLDVEPDLVRVGTHKTAGEMLTRESMSPEQREQIEAYLDDVYEELVAAIAAGRGLAPEAVRERIDCGPYAAPAAVEAGLADGLRYPDQVEVAIGQLAPETQEKDGSERVRLVDARLYERLHVDDPGWRPLLHDLPRIAYVSVSGPIRRGGSLGGISAHSLRVLLRRLQDDPGVRGVVLRLATPGGDAVASDLLWRGLHVLGREKPVVVSMGEVAASGGYFAAVAAESVLAEAATVTGSIGVVGGKVNLAGLYERLGVGRDGVERGRRAGMLSDARGFTPDERAVVRAEMEAIYDVFLRRVQDGRGLTRKQVERLAQGRIWSGRRAHSVRLVDLLGGPLEALREVRARAGIAESERIVVDVLPRLQPLAGLRILLGRGARASSRGFL